MISEVTLLWGYIKIPNSNSEFRYRGSVSVYVVPFSSSINIILIFISIVSSVWFLKIVNKIMPFESLHYMSYNPFLKITVYIIIYKLSHWTLHNSTPCKWNAFLLDFHALLTFKNCKILQDLRRLTIINVCLWLVKCI